ncbi:unnamed protein product [Arabidopsis lyrata]|uniref:Uncharacterized protein n=1 Tax=Arabidopsis lyrata subsp. lyrata TaxID=81972 RepID=D7MPH8_ARALL|nr:hypothetical protein ARALYDRAFT_918004 [Arabidopsis lyrata subsp. lyrata]CAH8279102.1 unnamed protein product [Arabidopsis lyrata]
MKSFFGVARLAISSLTGMGWSFIISSEVLLLDGSILSRKDWCFEDIQSHLASKKLSLRQCFIIVLVADSLALKKAFLDACFASLKQILFPKFPLVWSPMDDQDLSVLQGSSSRLIVSSTFVEEFITVQVIIHVVNQEDIEIVLVCWSLIFSL